MESFTWESLLLALAGGDKGISLHKNLSRYCSSAYECHWISRFRGFFYLRTSLPMNIIKFYMNIINYPYYEYHYRLCTTVLIT